MVIFKDGALGVVWTKELHPETLMMASSSDHGLIEIIKSTKNWRKENPGKNWAEAFGYKWVRQKDYYSYSFALVNLRDYYLQKGYPENEFGPEVP